MNRTVAAALLMERTVRNIYEEKGSTAVQPLQWSILRYLRSEPTDDARVATMATYFGIHHASVSRAVKTLIKRGYVAKRGGAGASRTSPLFLTQAGVDTLEHDPIRKLAGRIDALSQSDRQRFEELLTEIALGSALDETKSFDPGS